MTRSRLRSIVDSVRRRRYNCEGQTDASWDERARAAVDMARTALDRRTGPLAVADLGCGNERLHPLLRARYGDRLTYQGYDLHPQGATSIRLDVAHDDLPTADLTFVLGVVEYLEDPTTFLRRLARASSAAVVSYSVVDSAEPLTDEQRRARGWCHHYTGDSFAELLRAAGFALIDTKRVSRGRTQLWSCLRRTPSED